jgi:DNA-binding LytR/AlgR family response regulator
MRSPGSRILMSTQNYYYLIETDQILYCKSNNSYTTFYLLNGEAITVSSSMKEIEKRLDHHNFIRPHQSYLVNVKYIKAVQKNNACEFILKNGNRIPVSIRKRVRVIRFLEDYARIQE